MGVNVNLGSIQEPAWQTTTQLTEFYLYMLGVIEETLQQIYLRKLTPKTKEEFSSNYQLMQKNSFDELNISTANIHIIQQMR